MHKILIDIPETLETQNLRLVVPRAGYGEQLHKAILDGYDNYVKWLAWPEKIPSAEDVEIDCRNHHAEFITREFIRYIITDKKSGAVVGRCALPGFQANWSIPQFGVSYFIAKTHRGKGYGTEAAHALTKLTFQTLKAKKVEIYCDGENIPSQKIPEKLGFEHEYTTKGSWLRTDNALADLKCYALFDLENLKNPSF